MFALISLRLKIEEKKGKTQKLNETVELGTDAMEKDVYSSKSKGFGHFF